jgi:lipid-A-disaccharide synthase
MPVKLFLVAGEASGDLHGANLARALSAEDPSLMLIGMGGPRMAEAGVKLARNLDGMQVVGFYEVVRNIGFFMRVFDELLDRAAQEKPDAVVCIDYPGFNLRFAKAARKLGIPVFYYITPQVWAWHASRAKLMARVVDRAFVIFEFEVPLLERAGVRTEFVGHPLLDCDYGAVAPEEARRLVLNEARRPNGIEWDNSARIVAMMPGSRPCEASRHTRIFMEAAEALGERGGNIVFAVSDAGCGADAMIRLRRSKHGDGPAAFVVPSHRVPVPILAKAADFAVVASGTATLETALAGCPLAIVYRGGWLSYFIAHQFVNLPVISLVNIVLGRYAFEELLQGECNARTVAAEILRGLTDLRWREEAFKALAELPRRLGGPGASRRAAAGILNALRGRGSA